MKRLYHYYKQEQRGIYGWETCFEINVFNDRCALLFDFYFSQNYISVYFLCFNFIWYRRLMPDCGWNKKSAE